MMQTEDGHSRYNVLVAVEDAADLPLVTLACQLARQRDGEVCVLTVAASDVRPEWLELPDSCDDVPAEIVIRADKNISHAILHEVQ
ncbi:MAG TPA: hypothetical protein VLM78_05785, partial [Anaerolineales bacterium]|nr:hypothetical protein [Anaerolineales bacterium]